MISSVKSLFKYKHLLSLDLSSYGAALAIINQFVDGEIIRDFEVAPCGASAQIILLSQDDMALELVQAQLGTLLASQILKSALIKNIHSDLLNCYLGQNKPQIEKSILVLETCFLSSGLKAGQSLLVQNIQIVDFRVVRTNPKNVIVIATAVTGNVFSDMSFEDCKVTVIDPVDKALRQLFEIS